MTTSPRSAAAAGALSTLAIALGAPAAQASTTTVLDFTGAICGLSGTTSCGSGNTVGQSYGDIAGVVDVIWDGNRSTATSVNIFTWGAGYETLPRVGYGTLGGGGMSITFQMSPGYEIILNGFDIAPYVNRVRNSVVRVFDLDGNTSLFDTGTFQVSTDGVTSYANPGDWTSTTGLRIELGPDAWDVGISNISYTTQEASTTGVIPLPPAGLLLLSGIFGLAAVARRRA